MIKYSICVDAVFQGRDIGESLEVISRLGFQGFEFWTWWDKDIPALVDRKDTLGLEVTACCTRFVSLVDPSLRNAYVDGLAGSLDAARTLGCTTLISQVGNERPDTPRRAQQDALVQGLLACVPLLEGAGVTLVIEPLNTRVDHPGYYLTQSAEALTLWTRWAVTM